MSGVQLGNGGSIRKRALDVNEQGKGCPKAPGSPRTGGVATVGRPAPCSRTTPWDQSPAVQLPRSITEENVFGNLRGLSTTCPAVSLQLDASQRSPVASKMMIILASPTGIEPVFQP